MNSRWASEDFFPFKSSPKSHELSEEGRCWRIIADFEANVRRKWMDFLVPNPRFDLSSRDSDREKAIRLRQILGRSLCNMAEENSGFLRDLGWKFRGFRDLGRKFRGFTRSGFNWTWGIKLRILAKLWSKLRILRDLGICSDGGLLRV